MYMLIHEVATKLNVSKRTIRYYEQVGLVQANVNKENGYRVYDERHIQRLQQIIYFRSLQVPVKDIRRLLNSDNKSIKQYLQDHLFYLQNEQRNLNELIEKVITIINTLEGIVMGENFEQQKQRWMEQNEQQYGAEVRQRHGEESVLASYGKLKEMTAEQYEAAEGLQQMLFERLKEAMEEDAPELLLEIAELHKRWLSFYWPKYTKEAHVGLAQMYTMDERFTQYYDEAVGDGATELLYEAIVAYSKL